MLHRGLRFFAPLDRTTIFWCIRVKWIFEHHNILTGFFFLIHFFYFFFFFGRNPSSPDDKFTKNPSDERTDNRIYSLYERFPRNRFVSFFFFCFVFQIERQNTRLKRKGSRFFVGRRHAAETSPCRRPTSWFSRPSRAFYAPERFIFVSTTSSRRLF